MKFFHDFREFAVRGNVIDMGIGVIIGTAFGKIVDSLVTDIIMPPIGLMLGKVDFSNLFINLSNEDVHTVLEAREAGAATINYGLFVNTIIHFVIVAFATYLIIRQINRMKKAPMESITKKECPHCFTSIPTLAQRCPNCTTYLDELPSSVKSSKNPRLKVRVR
ncbi:large conductance mechanosensitive channel [Bacillus mesophilus]|uniref:Large-conductance mechanosensitive channel n=1 Tax=Bacillus mesophilus TaxID=1808955 RepID=A0A6M0QBW8_9BACI|nr:large-conductance mechanosensitive channel protein MscL [Bacillus mesophilus]MBM7663143.1 large conductance mechanosensitive channel [Bacillus mesophilus]NEY73881.1 large-conductance mechanosensitive channel protein MscL [Bacillus mesophilus]